MADITKTTNKMAQDANDTISKAAQMDVLLKMYQENWTHARHHETIRSTISTIIVAIAAGVLGLVKYDKEISSVDFPLALMLVGLGLFGAFFSYKHYERFHLHLERARVYRDTLDNFFPNKEAIIPKEIRNKEKEYLKLLPNKETIDTEKIRNKEKENSELLPKGKSFSDQPIMYLKQIADAEHSKKFPIFNSLDLQWWWVALNLFIAFVGMILALMTYSTFFGLLQKQG